MFIHYVKLGLRNLRKKLSYTVINLTGLSLSLTAAILLLTWVYDEVNINQFHEHKDNLFKVMKNYQEGHSGLVTNDILPYPMVDVLAHEFDEVEYAVGVHFAHPRTIHQGDKKWSAVGSFASFDLFKAFTFPMLEGDLNTAEQTLDGIYISEDLAAQYFGSSWRGNAVGKTITLEGSFEEKPFDYTILGVFENIPENSTFQFDFITNLDILPKNHEWIAEWSNAQMRIYIQLRPEINLSAFSKKLTTAMQEKYGQEKIEFTTHKFADHYLQGSFRDGKVSGGRIVYVRIFFLAALFLIGMACINFVNLTTAQSVRKSKEIGVRKVIGAGRRNIIMQALTETGIIVFTSILIATLLAIYFLPSVANWTDKSLIIPYGSIELWCGLIGLGLLVTLIAGWYPSIVLSNTKISNSLQNISAKSSGITMRKTLVVFQFVIAILLISGATIVREQIHYILNKNLGFNIEQIVSVPANQTTLNKYEAFKTELLGKPGITDVTSTSHQPLIADSRTSDLIWPGKDPNVEIDFSLLWADHRFADVFDLTLLQGSYYHRAKGEETQGIVINETAAHIMGMDDPIGQIVEFWEDKVQIIGLVKDFHNQKLQSNIDPMILLLDESFISFFQIVITPNMTDEALASIEEVHQAVAPGEPFSYTFLDEGFASLYKSEMLTGKIADYFALIALLIACLGLLGLSNLLAEQKVREIGIRKILGATVTHITVLLSKKYFGLILLGLLLAIPISWYTMNAWLATYAFSTKLTAWHLLIPTGIILIMALLTLGIISLRAALAHPVEALRRE